MKFNTGDLYLVEAVDAKSYWKVVARFLGEERHKYMFDDVYIVRETSHQELQKNWTIDKDEMDTYATFKFIGKTVDDIPEYFL